MFKITIPTKESGQIYVTNMLTRGRRTCLRQCRDSSGVVLMLLVLVVLVVLVVLKVMRILDLLIVLIGSEHSVGSV